VKTSRSKPQMLGRRERVTASRRLSSSASDLSGQVDERTRELAEALEQQAATSEVLKVISRSTFDLQAVLNTLVASAARLCEVDTAIIYRPKGVVYEIVASFGFSRDFYEYMLAHPIAVGPGTITGQAAYEARTIHVHDVFAESGYGLVEAQKIGGWRTVLGVPMLREGTPIGVITLTRPIVRPFTDRQIELVETFADQPVIAIENVRLFDEAQQRTHELSESLEHQTATAKVLSIISSSPGELEPVFQAVLENATRICNAKFATLWRFEDDGARIISKLAIPSALAEFLEGKLHRPSPLNAIGRVIRSRQTIHITDYCVDQSYHDRDPLTVAGVELGGIRTLLAVPMLAANELIGTIIIYRQEVQRFTDKQIALLTSFANQAVIAMENVRLLNQLQQRTADLTESLQQQTTIADVLKVISHSTFDLQAVLDTLVESAARLCEAEMVAIAQPRGEFFRQIASYGFSAKYNEFMARSPIPMGRGSLSGRVLLEGKAVHIPDVQADPNYTLLDAKEFNFRTMLGVPLLREGTPIGVIVLERSTVRPFTNKQIELLTTFADQAVIAIENVRLFEAEQQRTRELSESLEQQTATSEVLRVISRSTGDPTPVFEAMLQNAVRMCGAEFGNLLLCEGDTFRIGANHGAPAAYVSFLRRESPFRIDPRLGLGRMLETKQSYQVADIAAAPTHDDKLRVATIELAGARTVLGVPMLRDGEMVGCIAIYRQEVRPFNDKQIELVQNFAAQAVIAIENTRLLNELRQRTDDLTESLEQQTATAKVLEVISRAAFDLQAVFETVVESSVRLCGADRAFIFRFDGELLRVAATYNATAEFREWVAQHPITPGRHSVAARAALERRTIHIPDALADPDYSYGVGAKGVEAYRTLLGVPILKGDDLLGVMVIYHLEVRPFTDKQIILVETFADQAAIAIENVRLLDELRQHTDALGRSVGELRALGEVSQAVNSTLDVETVLRTIVTKAVELSSTDAGAIYVFDEERDEFRLRATYGMSEAMIAAISDRHIGVGDANVGEAARRREPIQIADAETKRRAFEGGAEALLTKPIDFTMLRNEIDTRVGPAA